MRLAQKLHNTLGTHVFMVSIVLYSKCQEARSVRTLVQDEQ